METLISLYYVASGTPIIYYIFFSLFSFGSVTCIPWKLEMVRVAVKSRSQAVEPNLFGIWFDNPLLVIVNQIWVSGLWLVVRFSIVTFLIIRCQVNWYAYYCIFQLEFFKRIKTRPKLKVLEKLRAILGCQPLRRLEVVTRALVKN